MSNSFASQVDSVYSQSFGRRKSWLVPAQLLCGGMMLWAGDVMDDWIGEDGGQPHINTLAAYFFALYFIMATQVWRPPSHLDPCLSWRVFVVLF